jgi:hypothetical protein
MLNQRGFDATVSSNHRCRSSGSARTDDEERFAWSNYLLSNCANNQYVAADHLIPDADRGKAWANVVELMPDVMGEEKRIHNHVQRKRDRRASKP